MTNYGFVRAVQDMGISIYLSPVGDRYVADTMNIYGVLLGGESSGHIIDLISGNIGDGLRLFSWLLGNFSKDDFICMRDELQLYPVFYKNLCIEEKLITSEKLTEITNNITDKFKYIHAVIRKSGTEPVIRVYLAAKELEVDNLSIFCNFMEYASEVDWFIKDSNSSGSKKRP